MKLTLVRSIVSKTTNLEKKIYIGFIEIWFNILLLKATLTLYFYTNVSFNSTYNLQLDPRTRCSNSIEKKRKHVKGTTASPTITNLKGRMSP